MVDSGYSVVFILHKNSRVKYPGVSNFTVLFEFPC